MTFGPFHLKPNLWITRISRHQKGGVQEKGFNKIIPLSNEPKNDIFQDSKRKLNFSQNDNYVLKGAKPGSLALKTIQLYRNAQA